MDKNRQALPEMQDQAAPPAPSPEINFEEPVSPADLKAEVSDVSVRATPERPVTVISEKEMTELRKEADREDKKRDFVEKVMAARTQPEPEHVMPPVAPRIQHQTNAELEAGRAAVKRAEEQQAMRPRREPEQETGSKPIFRPADYVPDQKKGQGRVQARTL